MNKKLFDFFTQSCHDFYKISEDYIDAWIRDDLCKKEGLKFSPYAILDLTTIVYVYCDFALFRTDLEYLRPTLRNFFDTTCIRYIEKQNRRITTNYLDEIINETTAIIKKIDSETGFNSALFELATRIVFALEKDEPHEEYSIGYVTGYLGCTLLSVGIVEFLRKAMEVSRNFIYEARNQ